MLMIILHKRKGENKSQTGDSNCALWLVCWLLTFFSLILFVVVVVFGTFTSSVSLTAFSFILALLQLFTCNCSSDLKNQCHVSENAWDISFQGLRWTPSEYLLFT